MCKSVKSLAKGAVIPCIEAIGRDALRVPSPAVGTDRSIDGCRGRRA